MSIRLVGVRKSYDGGVSFAVDDVSFAAGRGQLSVLLGESGCGKTTTLKIINRLVEPTAGRVLIDHVDTSTLAPVELRRATGYVFQGVGLFPHMTVADNVGITPRLLGWDSGRRRGRVEELLDLVRLDPASYGPRMPAELSGGEQQRVGFARALAAEPSVLLLDEPFGALDPITRDRLREDFRAIQQQLAITAVMVTHDMTEALLLADRIVVMREGKVVGEGRPRELLCDEIGDDYVKNLMQAPRREVERLAGLSAPGAAGGPRA